MRLKGKTALIAGAARNNGRAIALTFAREGADLVLVARQQREELDNVAAECAAHGVRVITKLADVSDPDQATQVATESETELGRVDILLTAVGVRPHTEFWKISNEEWLQVFAVNLHATFYLARALAPFMMERKSGNIIALGGAASLRSQHTAAAIVASKHALYGLIKSIARELGPYGIRANLLALAKIQNKRLNPEWYAAYGDSKDPAGPVKDIPLRRLGTREEVANVALFLASDESSFTTGDRITCNGGILM